MEFIRSDELLFEGKGWAAIHRETEEATLEGYGTEDKHLYGVNDCEPETLLQ